MHLFTTPPVGPLSLLKHANLSYLKVFALLVSLPRDSSPHLLEWLAAPILKVSQMLEDFIYTLLKAIFTPSSPSSYFTLLSHPFSVFQSCCFNL